MPINLKLLASMIIRTRLLVTMIMSLMPSHHPNIPMLKTTIPTTLPPTINLLTLNHNTSLHYS